MESCIGANYWGREFKKLGHEVKLISPKFVRPYVKTNKNDRKDAESICEAVSRPTMRFVPVKTVEQADIQALHRSKSLLIKNRAALVNQIRCLLAEYGLAIAKSRDKVQPALIRFLDEENERLTPFARETFFDLYEQLRPRLADREGERTTGAAFQGPSGLPEDLRGSGSLSSDSHGASGSCISPPALP